MHLAICDDNIADRKQTERLLGRESDRRLHTTGVLYIDSYGNKEALLAAPMIYDGVFLDMAGEPGCAEEIIRRVRQEGSAVPIVLCSSGIDYEKLPGLPEGCLFLKKPLQPDALSRMCDRLLDIKNAQVKRLEYRTLTETIHPEEQDILCALPGGRTVSLHLTDGSVYELTDNLNNFCASIPFADAGGGIWTSPSSPLAILGGNVVVNLRHIGKVGFSRLTMSDGTDIRFPFRIRGALLRAMENARKQF